MPRNTKLKDQLNIHEESKYFENSGWQVVENVNIPFCQELSTFKLPRRCRSEVPIPYFQLLKFISNDIWEILQFRVERELIQHTKIEKQLTNISELQEFLAVQLLFNATFTSNTREIRKHFAILKEKYKFKMGVNRWVLLRGCLVPTNEEVEKICLILRNNFLGFLDTVIIFFLTC